MSRQFTTLRSRKNAELEPARKVLRQTAAQLRHTVGARSVRLQATVGTHTLVADTNQQQAAKTRRVKKKQEQPEGLTVLLVESFILLHKALGIVGSIMEVTFHDGIRKFRVFINGQGAATAEALV